MPGGNSTYDEMLKVTGLTDEKRATFAEAFLTHGANAAKLWQDAADRACPTWTSASSSCRASWPF